MLTQVPALSLSWPSSKQAPVLLLIGILADGILLLVNRTLEGADHAVEM